MEEIFHSDETGCQCTKRIFFHMIADIRVSTHSQVHGPHEDCAILLLKTLIETEILPHTAAKPHQAIFLIRNSSLTFIDQLFDLFIEALCVCSCPLGTALPLCLHDSIDGIHYGNRNRMACSDHITDLFIVAFLLIDQVHDMLELVHIHHLSSLHLQIADQGFQLFDCQVDTVFIVQLFPAVCSQLIPV